MDQNEQLPILFFVSKTSPSYDEDLIHFQNLLDTLREIMPIGTTVYDLKPEIICIEENPEKAEEYKITALPVLFILNHYFLGISDTEKIIQTLKPPTDQQKTEHHGSNRG